jgi:hypothetical protein
MFMNKKTIIIIFCIIAVSFLAIIPQVANAEAAERVTSFFGFDTTSPQSWINSVYRYGITLIAVLSAVGIAYGGIRYLTSMGNQEAVTSGKQAIIAALSGLAIMLLSHMILRTIDPRLVELRLTVPTVDLGTCTTDSDCQEGQTCAEGTCVGIDDPRSSTACESDSQCEDRIGSGSRCLRPGESDSVCSDPNLGTNGNGCDENGGCQGSLRCVSSAGRNLCSDGNLGSPCSSDGDCRMENYECVGNFCRESEGASTPNGSACESNEDCQSGICSSGINRTCVDGATNSCNSDSDCAPGNYCDSTNRFSARCRPSHTEGGAECDRDSQCFSGNCDDGECTDTEWE